MQMPALRERVSLSKDKNQRWDIISCPTVFYLSRYSENRIEQTPMVLYSSRMYIASR
jgi:hypothetical protein